VHASTRDVRSNRELLLRGLPGGLVSDQTASHTAVDFAPFGTGYTLVIR